MIYKYIVHSQKDDYERLGWYLKPIYSRGDTGLAFLAVWLCNCTEVYPNEPRRSNTNDS
jgi:hypothetical protein